MPKISITTLRWVSLILIFSAVLISTLQLVTFSRIRNTFPSEMTIAGVPVSGLDRQQAAERIVQAYGMPIEIHYGDAFFQVKPGVLGFELNLESMLSAADIQRISQSFWVAFWDYLWNAQPSPVAIPLRATISEERMRAFLAQEIATRYDKPPSAAIPIPGSTSFQSGESGSYLDVDRALILISDELKKPRPRVVKLTFNAVSASRPTMQNLQILLQQTIALAGYQGLAEIYLLDLQTSDNIHFAVDNNELIKPDIAFTAASTMKIPIMLSVFRRSRDPLSNDITTMLESMIDRSDNPPADKLMSQVLNDMQGPLVVTDDLQALGFENSFLAGYFYDGAPLLRKMTTTANQRVDVSTNPDLYNQTTPAEMSLLLEDIYDCATNGGGALIAVFPGEITQNKCRQMVSLLTRNRIGVLIEAGLPDGTKIAHKHGWITDPLDGLIHTISDSGIVYTTGGNYILSIYLYNQEQLLFDPANIMVAQISRTIYNYFNLSSS